jgi:hypothetical protein
MEPFTLWLERFSDAWRLGDPDAVDDLFAPGATYQDSPFSAPLDGVDAIRAYWREGGRHSRRDVEFAAEALAARGDTGVAHWRAEFTSEPLGHRVELDGILVATIDAAGRCTSFREWWHRLEGRG